jgi:deoxyribonuclease V
LKIKIPTNITPRDAVKLQKKLAPLITENSELPPNINNLLGCDATYIQGKTLAAATLVEYETLQLLRTSMVKERTRFPYVPGLLAFREAPAVLRAIRALKAKEYICLVDAHGRAHPRKFGLACHIGLALNRSTIGVAKNLLYGRVKADRVLDRDGHPLAAILKLPNSEKTIYVSVGHKISLTDATNIVKHCLSKNGPLPVRLAHEEVNKQKWLLKRSNPLSS